MTDRELPEEGGMRTLEGMNAGIDKLNAEIGKLIDRADANATLREQLEHAIRFASGGSADVRALGNRLQAIESRIEALERGQQRGLPSSLPLGPDGPKVPMGPPPPPEQPAQSKAQEAAYWLRCKNEPVCDGAAGMLDAAERALGAFVWKDSGMYRLGRVDIALLREARRRFGLDGTP